MRFRRYVVYRIQYLYRGTFRVPAGVCRTGNHGYFDTKRRAIRGLYDIMSAFAYTSKLMADDEENRGLVLQILYTAS